jgi:exodeoxyribonuclease-3
MKIATWNVNGIRKRQAEVQEWIDRERPHIACLQEIKAPADQIPVALCEMEGYWCYWHGTTGYSGVGLHISMEIAPERPLFSHPPFDYENRIVVVRLPRITVASVYVPNGGKDFPAKMQFLAALELFAKEGSAEPQPLVICGDLNIARTDMDVHPKERKPGVVGQRPEERELFSGLLENLVDVGRNLHPGDANMFTWWAPWRNLRQRNIGWRLDYVLASPGVAARAQSCTVLAEVGTSDHAPVIMTIVD